jgi:hypothetical protein
MEMSTRSLTKRANVLARNPAPNLMLGMLASGTVASWVELNCGGKITVRPTIKDTQSFHSLP